MEHKKMKAGGYILHYLCGVLFALVYCIGKTICENHDFSGIAVNPAGFILALFAGGAAVGAGLMLFYRGLACLSGIRQPGFLDRLFSARYTYLGMWALLTTVHLVCFVSYYPGTFAYDLPSQTWQAYNYVEYNNHQPVLHTLLWAFFVRVGERLGEQSLALAFYSIFEIVCVTAVSILVVYAVRKIIVNSYAVLVSFLYYLLAPALHLMSFCTTKDVCFSCFITLFALSLYGGMKQDSKICLYGILISGTFSCMFRNNMVFVVLVVWVISLLMHCTFCIKAFLFSVICLYGCITKVIFPIAGIEEGPVSEALPVPISQLSGIYVMNPEILSEEEKTSIKTYMPDAEDFNPRIADYVKSSFQTDLLDSSGDLFWKTYFSVFKKAPLTYLTIFLDLNVDYWYLDAPFPDVYSQREYIETDTQEILDFFTVKPKNYFPAVRSFYDKVAAHEHWSMELPVIRYFYSMAFPFMFLALCLYLAVRNKNKLCVLPLGMLTALFLTYLLGPVSIFRYMYPYYLAMPLYFGMAAQNTGRVCLHAGK